MSVNPDHRRHAASSRDRSKTLSTQPLRHPRQEKFAKCFARSLDPTDALRQAGYPASAWSRLALRLLSIERMQERIRFLQRDTAEDLDPVSLVQRLYLDHQAIMARGYVRNPFTGSISFDPRRLTPEEMASLELSLISENGKLGSDARVVLRSGNVSMLTALWKIVSATNFAPNRKEQSSLADALREIARRNASTARLRSDSDEPENIATRR